MTQQPPADWSIERRREYFDWAKRVIDGLRDEANPHLEALSMRSMRGGRDAGRSA